MLVTPYGTPAVAQQKIPMNRAEIKRFIEFEDLLKRVGWMIVCPNCTRIFGYGKDGVRSNNSETGPYVVECACSQHVFDPGGAAN